MKEKKIHCPEVLDSESWSQHPLASGVVLVATLLPGRWEQGGNKGKNKSHGAMGPGWLSAYQPLSRALMPPEDSALHPQ